MMNFKYVMLWLMSVSCAAHAGDMGIPTHQTNWAGLYIGGNIGAGWGLLNNRLTIVNNTLNPLFYPPSIQGINQAGSNTLDPLRFVGGVQAGVNKELQHRLLLGLEVSYDYLDLSQTLQHQHLYLNDPIQKFYSIQNTASATQMGTLRPRLGYHIEDYLVYLTGGGAVTKIKYQQTFTDHQYALSNTMSYNQVRYGWTIGGGLEYFPHQAISFKLEYLYSNFGNKTLSDQLVGTGELAGLSATFQNSLNNIEIQTLLFGINWHVA